MELYSIIDDMNGRVFIEASDHPIISLMLPHLLPQTIEGKLLFIYYC